MKNFFFFVVILGLAFPVIAQEATPTPLPCTDQDKAGIEVCKAACDTAVPQCQDLAKAPITLEELRLKLAEKCKCESAKNYGQYESCVKKLMGALREFNMIDKATRVGIAADTKNCRKGIKDRKKNDKGKK